MSDQADKAAESIRVWKANYSETGKLRGGPCVWLYNPKGEAVVLMFPQDRPEAEGVIAEIVDGLNTPLIRSTVTAPRELVDSIRHLLFHLEREYTGNGSLPSQQLLIRDMNKVRSALSAQEPKVCEWTRTNNHSDGTWLTGCGKEYFVRTFTRVGYFEGAALVQPKHCPDCGSPIKVKE